MKEKRLNSPICIICGNKLATQYPKVNDPITGEVFVINKCIKCGLGHTCPKPINLMPYYGETYYTNRRGFTEGHCIRRRVKTVLSATKHMDHKRLLDIGCGNGAFLRAMSILGWNVAGTEINPGLELMKELAVRKHIEDFSDCAPFDCITMWHTLEHMENISTVLSQIYSLLRPGGKLIIAVPNNFSFQARLFKSKWLHLDAPRHIYHFDVTSLQNCLRMKGFYIERCDYQELEYDLLGWVQSSLNRIFNTPNIFLDSIRGKPGVNGGLVTMLNLFLGSLLVMLSLPAVMVERLFNRSGTIIMVVRKNTK
jgi:SAM-dependent methyltransferase